MTLVDPLFSMNDMNHLSTFMTVQQPPQPQQQPQIGGLPSSDEQLFLPPVGGGTTSTEGAAAAAATTAAATLATTTTSEAAQQHQHQQQQQQLAMTLLHAYQVPPQQLVHFQQVQQQQQQPQPQSMLVPSPPMVAAAGVDAQQPQQQKQQQQNANAALQQQYQFVVQQQQQQQQQYQLAQLQFQLQLQQLFLQQQQQQQQPPQSVQGQQLQPQTTTTEQQQQQQQQFQHQGGEQFYLPQQLSSAADHSQTTTVTATEPQQQQQPPQHSTMVEQQNYPHDSQPPQGSSALLMQVPSTQQQQQQQQQQQRQYTTAQPQPPFAALPMMRSMASASSFAASSVSQQPSSSSATSFTTTHNTTHNNNNINNVSSTASSSSRISMSSKDMTMEDLMALHNSSKNTTTTTTPNNMYNVNDNNDRSDETAVAPPIKVPPEREEQKQEQPQPQPQQDTDNGTLDFFTTIMGSMTPTEQQQMLEGFEASRSRTMMMTNNSNSNSNSNSKKKSNNGNDNDNNNKNANDKNINMKITKRHHGDNTTGQDGGESTNKSSTKSETQGRYNKIQSSSSSSSSSSAAVATTVAATMTYTNNNMNDDVDDDDDDDNDDDDNNNCGGNPSMSLRQGRKTGDDRKTVDYNENRNNETKEEEENNNEVEIDGVDLNYHVSVHQQRQYYNNTSCLRCRKQKEKCVRENGMNKACNRCVNDQFECIPQEITKLVMKHDDDASAEDDGDDENSDDSKQTSDVFSILDNREENDCDADIDDDDNNNIEAATDSTNVSTNTKFSIKESLPSLQKKLPSFTMKNASTQSKKTLPTDSGATAVVTHSNTTFYQSDIQDQQLTFMKIIDHRWKEGGVVFRVLFASTQGNLPLDIPFIVLKEKEPYMTARYIREYISEPRRGKRPLTEWAAETIRLKDSRPTFIDNAAKKSRSKSNIPNAEVANKNKNKRKQTIYDDEAVTVLSVSTKRLKKKAVVNVTTKVTKQHVAQSSSLLGVRKTAIDTEEKEEEANRPALVVVSVSSLSKSMPPASASASAGGKVSMRYWTEEEHQSIVKGIAQHGFVDIRENILPLVPTRTYSAVYNYTRDNKSKLVRDCKAYKKTNKKNETETKTKDDDDDNEHEDEVKATSDTCTPGQDKFWTEQEHQRIEIMERKVTSSVQQRGYDRVQKHAIETGKRKRGRPKKDVGCKSTPRGGGSGSGGGSSSSSSAKNPESTKKLKTATTDETDDTNYDSDGDFKSWKQRGNWCWPVVGNKKKSSKATTADDPKVLQLGERASIRVAVKKSLGDDDDNHKGTTKIKQMPLLYSHQKSSNKPTTTSIRSPRNADVLVVSGRSKIVYHPGNLFYKSLVEEQFSQHTKSIDKLQRHKIEVLIFGRIKSKNGRFLQKEFAGSEFWKELSEEDALKKVGASLYQRRYKTLKNNNNNNMPDVFREATAEAQEHMLRKYGQEYVDKHRDEEIVAV